MDAKKSLDEVLHLDDNLGRKIKAKVRTGEFQMHIYTDAIEIRNGVCAGCGSIVEGLIRPRNQEGKIIPVQSLGMTDQELYYHVVQKVNAIHKAKCPAKYEILPYDGRFDKFIGKKISPMVANA